MFFIDPVKYFWDVVLSCGPPEWATQNEITYEDSALRLRRFREGKGVPILILPPQAGHSSHIADYGPNQSLVQACIKNTKASVYVIDWKSCTNDRKNESINDLVLQVNRCVTLLKDEARLIGLCQGGWLATIYAARFSENVKHLILAGAPIDFAAGKGPLRMMAQNLPMSFFKWLVILGGGLMSGRLMQLGWKITKPIERFFLDYTGVCVDAFLGDEKSLLRTKKFRNWWEYPRNLAGRWYLQAIKELFKDNKLIRGELEVLGEKINLKNIKCFIDLISGENDELTPKEQLFNMAKYVSVRGTLNLICNAGHIGTFINKEGLANVWACLLRRMEESQE